MEPSLRPGHFIGRDRELLRFNTWLCDVDLDTPWICYVHDAVPDRQRRGGLGKTWLLRAYADLARTLLPELAIVPIDFFNVAERDRLLIAERIVDALRRVSPDWEPRAFTQALDTYRTQGYLSSLSPEKDVADIRIRDHLSDALQEDLAELERRRPPTQPTLLLLFDTYELIEHQPQTAVLGLGRPFPDTYGLQRLKVVLAGRHELDWQHPTWQGRSQEVLDLPLAPFSEQELRRYVASEALFPLSSPAAEQPGGEDVASVPLAPRRTHAPGHQTLTEAQLVQLHRLTEGRPILIGLAIDVLNQGLTTPAELVATPQRTFEEYLVAQINRLEHPLHWVILFMAHAFHRFTLDLLDWILQQTALREAVGTIQSGPLLETLLPLSFIRRANEGQEIALHDEMRRLVTQYCWERQDPDGRFRREISLAILRYDAARLAGDLSEPERQRCQVESLHHQLFLDLEAGLATFHELFRHAVQRWRGAFARTLLSTVQAFAHACSPAQRTDLQLCEVALLRIEEQPLLALQALERLKQTADPAWLEAQHLEVLKETARCCLQACQFEEAIRAFEEQLALARARGEAGQIGSLLGQLGYIHRRRGHLEVALQSYRESLGYYERSGDRAVYANMLNSIGMVYRLQGRIDEALRHCKIGLRIREGLWQAGVIGERSVGLSHSTLGMIYLDIDAATEAEQHFHRAFEAYVRSGYKTGIAATYTRLGQVALLQGQLQEAQTYFVRGEAASFGLDEEAYINSQHQQGRLCLRQLRWQEAATFLQRASDHARRLQDR